LAVLMRERTNENLGFNKERDGGEEKEGGKERW
jgi:hypothetical protein